jgi:hypothetical protein
LKILFPFVGLSKEYLFKLPLSRLLFLVFFGCKLYLFPGKNYAGSNTGVYIRELMGNCENIVSNYENNSTIKPAEVLIRSAAETQSPGSSSVLVAYFDGQVNDYLFLQNSLNLNIISE